MRNSSIKKNIGHRSQPSVAVSWHLLPCPLLYVQIRSSCHLSPLCHPHSSAVFSRPDTWKSPQRSWIFVGDFLKARVTFEEGKLNFSRMQAFDFQLSILQLVNSNFQIHEIPKKSVFFLTSNALTFRSCSHTTWLCYIKKNFLWITRLL